jgi:hypothetical protein
MIAAKLIADAPLGQVVTIQNSATAADRGESAPGIDESGQPIGHAKGADCRGARLESPDRRRARRGR